MIEFISQLPTEYQEVEYIESSGTQYIDTGVIPTVDTGVKVRGHLTSVQDGDNIILGASDQTAFANGKPYSVDSYPDRVYFAFGGFAGDSTDTITITQTKNKQYEYTLNYMDSGKASVDTLQITLSTRTSMTSNALYLFCLNGNGTVGYYAHFALEYLQITQGDSVIHDYVPCYRKADNVAGLYDLVTGTFFTNAGSGTFAVGNNSNKRGEWVITAGGIIPMQYALRRRMMMCSGPFSFEYTGTFTDVINGSNRIITLTSSGILTVKGSITSEVYMLAGGGGAAYAHGYWNIACSGGGGGYDTFTTELKPGNYPITIGTGGAAANTTQSGVSKLTGGTGGDTIAFDRTCTGGTGSTTGGTHSVGKGGSPNGENGKRKTVEGFDPITVLGGAPNGGKLEVIRSTNQQAYPGGDGYITITIPI